MLEDVVVLGDSNHPPNPDEMVELLADPSRNFVVNLLGVALEHRPDFFVPLLPRLQELRARTGRPHWIVVDEAHHLLPVAWEPAPLTIAAGDLRDDAHHDAAGARVAGPARDRRHGDRHRRGARETIGGFCRAVRETRAGMAPGGGARDGRGAALVAARGRPARLVPQPAAARRAPAPPPEVRRGRAAAERSFFFRGPEDKLNLRAQNLVRFCRLADGVDDETWLHHLRRGDYSYWFREVIGDEELSEEAAEIERARALSPAESRARIRAAVEERYTSPP